VRDHVLKVSAWYLTDCLWECHQLYTLHTVWGKDELIRFWDQKVKVTARPDMVRKALWELWRSRVENSGTQGHRHVSFPAEAYQLTII